MWTECLEPAVMNSGILQTQASKGVVKKEVSPSATI